MVRWTWGFAIICIAIKPSIPSHILVLAFVRDSGKLSMKGNAGSQMRLELSGYVGLLGLVHI